jgi:sarcosine/dimethylglycine N-methyltransferase
MKEAHALATYTTGLSRKNIEHALIAAGHDLDQLQPADLALLEDFHTMGRLATSQLTELAGITSGDKILDAGSGIGGTARFVADRYRCVVSTVDVTQEYCDTARWLNRLVGLDELISVHHGDVTRLPFADDSFQVVISQHVQMNVADKRRLYNEAHRTLTTGGRLAMWDVVAGTGGEPDYPMPWADRPAFSHLATPEELRADVESAGFAIDHWNDLTDSAAEFMRALLAEGPKPLGLHVFVPDFAVKVQNLSRALADRRVRLIQGVARALS